MRRVLPILFNTEMVRAILDGRKTCTRRVIKAQPDEKHTFPLGFVTGSTEAKELGCFGFGTNENGGSIQFVKPPYQAGDILYVRETFHEDEDCIFYKADNEKLTGYRNMRGENVVVKWRPSIHMRKETTRIWLKVTDVRVERLQDMTDDDAEAEGCFDYTSTALGFPDVWDSTIKKSDIDRYGWDANPYVWVIEFERCEKPKGV